MNETALPSAQQTAYFAHSKRDYGTDKERHALAFLKENHRVFCPHHNLGETGSIAHYLNVVTWCDCMIVMEHKGHIGKGVFQEVNHAISQNKLVWVLRGKSLIPIKCIEIVDETDWCVRYGKITT